jgi:hypothetical protein
MRIGISFGCYVVAPSDFSFIIHEAVARRFETSFPENDVQGLVLVHVLIWATMLVLLWAGAAWLQGYIYSEPAGQLYWRAPAVAALLTLWLGFWSNREYRAYLDDREPSRYGALYQFSATDKRVFEEFWVKEGDQKVRYMKHRIPQANRPGRPEFVSEATPHHPWTRTDEIILKENKLDVVYKIQKDKNNKVKEAALPWPATGTKGALYRSDSGGILTEDMVRTGRSESFRWGPFFTYALLNFGFLTLWFIGLWVVLRFQWAHALGLSLALWAAAIIFIVPPLVERVDNLADAQPQASRVASS